MKYRNILTAIGLTVSILFSTGLKKLGIGYENYKEFIDADMYYVDKTMLIRDEREKGGKVTLFTRPRRFGKTLALSMLRTFFELEYDLDGKVVDKKLKSLTGIYTLRILIS